MNTMTAAESGSTFGTDRFTGSFKRIRPEEQEDTRTDEQQIADEILGSPTGTAEEYDAKKYAAAMEAALYLARVETALTEDGHGGTYLARDVAFGD